MTAATPLDPRTTGPLRCECCRARRPAFLADGHAWCTACHVRSCNERKADER